MEFRIEKDTMGEVKVPADAYFGAQTQRSIENFRIAQDINRMPKEIIRAFAYLKNTDLTALKVGRFQVWGDSVYVTVTESASKDSALTRWEGHKNYADIHYMITGKEKIGVGPLKGAKNIVPYDEIKDIGFYETQGKFYEASSQVFFIFFPNLDAHRPGVKVPDGGTEKKLVIKILTEK